MTTCPALKLERLRELLLIASDGIEPFPGLRLHEDLGIDSLEMASLLLEIENQFGIRLQADTVQALHTVADLQGAVAGQGRHAPS